MRLPILAALASLAFVFGAAPARAQVCSSTTFVQSGGGANLFPSISGAVAALPTNLAGSNGCVKINDSATYNEQVTVAGITTGGGRIFIQPSGANTPVVSPPAGSTAAFSIQNASVTIFGVTIAPSNAMPYGVYASSANVAVSSVAINDAGGQIDVDAVVIADWGALTGSTITVTQAEGVLLAGTGAKIFASSVTAGTAVNSFNGLTIQGSSNTVDSSSITAVGIGVGVLINGATNTLVRSVVTTVNFKGVELYGAGAYGNTIAFSSVSAANASSSNWAVWINGASSNTITNSFITSPGGGGVEFYTGARNNTLIFSTVTVNAPLDNAVEMNGASSNTITNCYISNANAGYNTLNIQSGGANTISFSTMTGSQPLAFAGTSSNVVTNCYMHAVSNGAVGYQAAANDNTIMFSTMDTVGAQIAVSVSGGSSSNTITRSVIRSLGFYAAEFFGSAGANTISWSTMTTTGSGNAALYLTNAATNVFSNDYIANPAGYGAEFATGATSNTIVASTVASNSGFGAASWFGGASSNAVVASFLTNTAGPSAYFSGAGPNAISYSTMSSAGIGNNTVATYGSTGTAISSCTIVSAAGTGVSLNGYFETVAQSSISSAGGGGVIDSGTGSLIVQDFVYNTGSGIGLQQSGASLGTVSFSTIVAQGAVSNALSVNLSVNCTIANSYAISPATVAWINNSTGTSLSTNTFVTTNGAYAAVWSEAGSSVTVSGNALTGGIAGVFVGAFGGGLVNIASNTISANASNGNTHYGVFVGSEVPGSAVWITSNTIIPAAGVAAVYDGIFLNSLPSGATVAANSIYAQTAGAGAALNRFGIAAQAVYGGVFLRNRLNFPSGTIGAANSITALALIGSPNAELKFNDVYGAGSSASFFGFSLASSSGAVVTNNIVVSSLVSGSSATISVDALSQTGLQSNYNDFYNTTGNATASCAGAPLANNGPWTCGVLQDRFSLSSDPLWFSNSAGSEDFHPKSPSGRWVSANGAFTFVDTSTSPTIDAGDPAESYAAEVNGNYRANLGSYGGTSEASQSPNGYCAVNRFVCRNGLCPNRSIAEAVGALPNPLPGYACVYVEDSATYPEAVLVSGFALNGSSVTIEMDPSMLGIRPVVAPTVAVPAAFMIQSASVTLSRIDVTASVANTGFGIRASSSGVTISSVSIVDASGFISTAAISITGGDSVILSTIQVANANGVEAAGAGNLIWGDSVTVSGAAEASGHYGIYLNGVTGSTVTQTGVAMPSTGHALEMEGGTSYISFSTFASQGASLGTIHTNGVTASTITHSYVYEGAGTYGLFMFTSNFTLDQSTVVVPTAGGSGVLLSGSNNAVSGSSITAASTALYMQGGSGGLVANSTMTGTNGLADTNVSGLTVTNSFFRGTGGSAVNIYNGAGQVSVVGSTMIAGSSIQGALYFYSNASSNTIANSYIYNPSGPGALLLGVSSITIRGSTIAASGNLPSLLLQGAADSLFSTDYMVATTSNAASFDATSTNDAIFGSTLTAPGLLSNSAALQFLGAAGSVVSGSVITGGVDYESAATRNQIFTSTVTNAAFGFPALNFFSATYNTVTGSYIYSSNESAAVFGNTFATLATQNLVTQSALVNASAGSPAVTFTAGSSTNTFVSDAIINPSGSAMFFQQTTSNTVVGSTLTSGGSTTALFSFGASTNSIVLSSITNLNGTGGPAFYMAAGSTYTLLSQDFLSSNGNTIVLLGMNGTVVQSTVATSNPNGAAVYVSAATGSVVVNSYLQGSSAAFVSGGIATSFGADYFAATGGAQNSGLALASGSNGLTVSSSVVAGPAVGAGITVLPSAGVGSISLTSNTILSGPQFGIYIATGGPILVASNTVLGTVGSSTNTYGMYFTGVANAVVSGNQIYYRGSGSMGTQIAYGAYAQASSIQFDHNRVNQPGAITGGGYIAMKLVGAPSVVKFNDFAAVANGLSLARLLELTSASGFVVKDNAFLNEMINTSPNYSVAINVDAASQAGLQSDYNDYYVTGPGAFIDNWGAFPGSHSASLSGYRTATGGTEEQHSIFGDPLWPSLTAGSEEFHPKSSQSNGRYSPATHSFSVTDSSSSVAIDAGDPSEPYGNEPLPNGLRANCGSYGNTTEASESAPPPGCDEQRTVAQSGVSADATSITSAIGLFTVAHGTTLNDNWCVVVVTTTTLFEEVDINGLNANGHRLTIMGHPNLTGGRATVDPTGGTDAGFLIQNTSVTIFNIDVNSSGSIPFGIVASSQAAIISSVNVLGSNYTNASLWISTGANVAYTTAATTGATALKVVGTGATVFASSFTNVSASSVAVALLGATNAFLSNDYVFSFNNNALTVMAGSNGNSIVASTAASYGAGASALLIDHSSFNTVAQFYAESVSGGGVLLSGNSYANAIWNSTMTSASVGNAAYAAGGSSNSVVASLMTNPNGTAVFLQAAQFETIAQSTATSANSAAVVVVAGSTSTLFNLDYFYNSGTGSAGFYSGNSVTNVSSNTTFWTDGAGGNAVSLNSSSQNSFSACTMQAPAGTGVQLNNSSSNLFAGVTMYGAASGGYGFLANGGSNNALSGCTLTEANGWAAGLLAGTVGNAISNSNLTSQLAGKSAALISASSNNTIYGSVLNGGFGDGVDIVQGGSSNQVLFSTADGYFGVSITSTSASFLTNDYIQGSTAVVVVGSSLTTVDSSVLYSTSSLGIALDFAGGSAGLIASSNTMTGGSNRAAVFIDAGSSGTMILSTNTFVAGSIYSMYVATPAAGATLWITSNTFALAPNATATSLGGLYLNGLANGATVENNGFYARVSGSMGTGVMFGLEAQSSNHVVVDHNRFSNPGQVTVGSYAGVILNGATSTTLKFNDFLVTTVNGSPLTSAYGIQMTNSPGTRIADNAFLSSMTVTFASATVAGDGGSVAGFSADYNEYFSSTSRNSMVYSGISYQYPWSSLGFDVHSSTFHPRWFSTAPGAEDFHPLSQAGRFATGGGGPTQDAWTAGTIDAGDPAEPHAAEQGANDRYANVGSYGGTSEASESPAAPGAPSISAVFGSSVAISFAAAGGPGSPRGYGVVASTMPDLSGAVFSSATLGVQLTLAPQSLAFNTTYYFGVLALWGDLAVVNPTIVSTITLPTPPAQNPGGSFRNMTVVGGSFLWLPNGNPVSQTTYTVIVTTGPSYPNSDLGNVTITTAPAGSPDQTTLAAVLSPNTTYFAFVSAVSGSGQSSQFVALGSTWTLANQPGINLPFVTALSSASMSVTWGANGNPIGVTTYTVVLSTDPFPNSDSGNVSLTTAPTGAPAATLTGLAPDATYYFEVAAVSINGGPTTFNFLGNPSTMTAASPPLAGPFVVPSSFSITASWTANGNPAGVLYDLVTSSDPAFAVATTSSFTYSLSASTAGLSPNTTYYFKVLAENGQGYPSAFVALNSTASLAALPATLASTFTSVNASSYTALWSANGNPAGTSYIVQTSTASDFNAFASSFSFSTAPVGPAATFTGLSAFTTYYFRVAAVNWNSSATVFVNLGSTQTAPPSLLPPGVAGVPVVATTTISASWTIVGAATGYYLAASTFPTNPPTLIVASSQPIGVNATSATLGGLVPDTTYFLFVQADGIAAVSSFTAFAATSTLPAPPLTAATTFTAVAFTSFTVSWSANGNPLGVATYTVVASTASDFNAFASSVSFSTVPAAGPSATFTGLFADATYYFEVMAVGNSGAITPFTALGSTTTRPAAPSTAANPFPSVSSSAVALTWGSNSNMPGVTPYLAVVSTASDFNAFASSVTLSTTPSGNNPSATLAGLAPNTTYYAGALTFGVNGSSSPLTAFGSTSTLAALPSTGAFTTAANSIVANWTGGGNPAGTLYDLVTSSDPAFSVAVVTTFTYATTYSSASLVPNTSYYFKIQAINNGGTPTGFVTFGATSTLANAPLPVASTFSAVNQTSVTVNWSANGNPIGLTNYIVQASTASDFNAFASSVTLTTAPTAGLTATVGGLAFGTTYYFRVVAVNNGGFASAPAVLGSTTTLLSNLIPQIVNAQAGDTTWRATNTTGYAVRFVDGSGTHLDKFQVSASTVPGGAGPNLIGFTDVRTSLSPADSFSSTWTLPTSVFNALLEGVTNYITVRVYNNVPATSTVVDAFFVLKDTTPPTIVNPLAGGDATVRSSSGTAYPVTSSDAASGLSVFQYSVSLNKLSGDASLIPWTNIAALPQGVTSYSTPWTVNFPLLANGTSNYVSVRAVDVAGSTTQVTDAFVILKDTVGPTVTISSPSVASGFVSGVPAIAGAAFSSFTVKGTEVAAYQVGAAAYWDPVALTFTAGTPKWMAATGTTSWILTTPIAFSDGQAYQLIARSSTTFGEYSTTYATASFVFDASTPTVGVLAPVPNSTISSLPIISGTAADPSAGTASGVSSVEVRLMRESDGLWWNWFAQTWGAVAVSTIAVGTTTWSVTPSSLLQANLLTGASYFVAVRASDNAQPPNQGNFFVSGATFTYSNGTPPAAPANLTAVSGGQAGQVLLSWVSPGENGNSGIVLSGHYAVFYATYGAATPSTAAAQVLLSTAGVVPGTTVSYTVPGLTPSVTYFLEVALQNTDGNWSPFSNQASTNATPAPLNAINGHVVDASTNGITGVEVDAYDNTGALVSTTFTLADGSGTYSVGGLTPGTWKLQASWTVNGVTSSVWQDGIPMGSINVDFSLQINYALATLTGTLATLTTSAVRTGTTPAALASPQGGSFVEVQQRGRTITRVGVQPSGRWTVPSLLPGSYKVRAFTGVSYTDYQSVTLNEGETRNIGFVFDPLPDTSVFAFPNPAKNSTTFRFVTPFAAGFQASIDIFDVAGRFVREIPGSAVVQQLSDPTVYHADWDLTNSNGQAVASGVYIFIVKVKGDQNQIVKVVKKLAVVR